MDAPDYQNVFLGLDFADGLGDQFCIRCIDLTRFQRASKGSGQSTGGGRHDVIQRGGVRLDDVFRNSIVFGDCPVHPENHWGVFGRKICQPHGPFEALNPDLRTINHLGHLGVLRFLNPHGMGLSKKNTSAELESA